MKTLSRPVWRAWNNPTQHVADVLCCPCFVDDVDSDSSHCVKILLYANGTYSVKLHDVFTSTEIELGRCDTPDPQGRWYGDAAMLWKEAKTNARKWYEVWHRKQQAVQAESFNLFDDTDWL